MVQTPKGNVSPMEENPILYYGIDNGEFAPTEWKFVKIIADTPDGGYNSDPTMELYNHCLYIIWRQVCPDGSNTSYSLRITKLKSENGVLLQNDACDPIIKSIPVLNMDYFISPALYSDGNNIHLLSFANIFHKYRIGEKNRFFKKLFSVLNIFGCFSNMKFLCCCDWSVDLVGKYRILLDGAYFIGDINPLYQPWHFDYFAYDGDRFLIIQMNQEHPDFFIAKLVDDSRRIEILGGPLLSSRLSNLTMAYKSSVVIYGDFLYMYLTTYNSAKQKNEMCLYCENLGSLMNKLKKSV